MAHTIDSPTRHLVEITYTSPAMMQPLIKYGDPLRIVDQLDETGVMCLENAVPTEWLADVRTEVQDWLLNHGVRNHLIHLPQGEGQSAADAFVNNRAVLSRFGEIARTRFPDAHPEFIVSALRVAAEPRSENDAFGFHYDASVVTMIVPIFLPDAEPGNAGEFVALLNKRPFRRFVLSHIIDKAIGQSRLYRSHILRRLDRTGYLQKVDMELGNLYLFWGYRSLHGNMPCESGALRTTLILHFGRTQVSGKTLTAAARLGRSLRTLGQKPTETEATVGAY